MKRIIILTFLLLSFGLSSQAQSVVFAKEPQWKFWLAFENADGQRDTLYFVFDSTATWPRTDSLLGEYKIHPDTNKFQVFFGNGIDTDSTKVIAQPTNLGGGNAGILATMDQYPIIVRWDSTLIKQNALSFPINTATIQNTYTLLKRPGGASFNLRLSDSLYLPPFTIQGQPASHFAMNLSFGSEPATTVAQVSARPLKVSPNPFTHTLTVEVKDPLASVQLFTLALGSQVIDARYNGITEADIDTQSLPSGLYLLKITFTNNLSVYEKIIKY